MRLPRLTLVLSASVILFAYSTCQANDPKQIATAPPFGRQRAAGRHDHYRSHRRRAGARTRHNHRHSRRRPASGAGNISIDANGVKQVQSEEYGKKISITDDPQKGIKIERTFHKGGSDETKTYEAKDIKELEKRFPEGFKLYQQYLGNQVANGGAVIVQAQGMAVPMVPGQPMPVPFPMPGAPEA